MGCHFLLQGIFPTPSSGDLSDPILPGSPTLRADSSPSEPEGKPHPLPRPFLNYQPHQPFSTPRNRSSCVLLIPVWVMVPRAEDNVVSNIFQCLSAPHPGPRPKRLLPQPHRNSLALHPALSLFILKLSRLFIYQFNSGAPSSPP